MIRYEAERAIYSTWGPNAKDLTRDEKLARHIAHNQPHLTTAAIKELRPDQQGFAIVERGIEEAKWERSNTDIIKPEGLEVLDF